MEEESVDVVFLEKKSSSATIRNCACTAGTIVSPNLSDEKPVQRFKYLLLYRRNFIKYLEIFYFVIK